MAESSEFGVAGEFGVTGDGELDLGLAAAAPRHAPAPGGGRPVPPSGDGALAGAELADGGWLDDYPDPDPPDDEPVFSCDPESDPGDFEAWLAGLPAGVREELLAGPFTGEGPVPAGFLHHERAGPAGVGFASGGVLDTAEPDWWLARALENATGWGEHYTSCLTGRYVEHPQSQPAMTAWALLTLARIVGPGDPDTQRAERCLIALQAQGADGGWPQQAASGVFFQTAVLDYRLYKDIFPTWALARTAGNP